MMRGLLKAFLLLAPALASSMVMPDVEIEHLENDRVIADNSFALIGIETLRRSPEEREVFAVRLDVLPSEEPCGLGKVTIDGQALPQTVNGDLSTGSGHITTDRKNIISASWSFHCVKVNGLPDSQFLKFVIDVIDGKAVEDAGFSALFRQNGSTEIINIETDLSLPDKVAANPNPEGLLPVGQEDQEPHFDIEHEMNELHWMRAQLKELEYLIFAKEQAINAHAHAHFQEEIKDCDSLKCLAKAILDKAHRAANRVMGHHADHHHGVGESDFGHFPKPPFKKPEWWPGNSKKHGNHTCGPHKHGNHTHGNHTHGNHTHPRPPWKKPHHKPLPICRYPPPPKKGSPPHHPPPHHGPPSHDERPSPPHRPHFESPEDNDFPPHHHEDFQHERPHHDHFRGPEDDSREPPRDGHHGPGHEGPHDHPHGGPDSFDHPSHGHFKGPEDDSRGPPREDHHGPGHERPHDHPHGGPDHFNHPPPFEVEAPFMLSPSEHGPPGPHPFDGPPNHQHGPGPHSHGLHPAFHVLKFVVIGVLLSLLFIALHRRNCTARGRANRKARSEERRRRRSYRRAAHKNALVRFFSSHFDSVDSDSDDYEEKRQVFLASEAEDGMSTTMSEEISQFRNAADVVDEMVSAHQVQPISIPNAAVSEDRDFDLSSQVGDGEELPAYEDNDGSEMSSMVADGFRYTPGSTEYSPANSVAGSVSDILGPDTKM